MEKDGEPTIRITCPCCGSTLMIDAAQGIVREWKEAQDPRRTADLKDAEKLLHEEKARVEARYREIVKADKEKVASMNKKFKDFLEKSQSEPPARPLRDVDLD